MPSTDPGKRDKMNCNVCSSNMDVKRNVYGPTGMAEAMAKKGHSHDSFTCPHVDKDWHRQASKILRELENTSSPTLEELLKKDMEKIIETRKATKKVSRF